MKIQNSLNSNDAKELKDYFSVNHYIGCAWEDIGTPKWEKANQEYTETYRVRKNLEREEFLEKYSVK